MPLARDDGEHAGRRGRRARRASTRGRAGSPARAACRRGAGARAPRVSAISAIPREPLPRARLDERRQLDRRRVEVGVGDLAARHPDVALAGLLQPPLVEAGLERRLAREHELRCRPPRTRPRARASGEQLAVDGRDQDVDAALARRGRAATSAKPGSSPRGRIARRSARHDVEAGGVGIDVGRVQLQSLARVARSRRSSE